MLLKRAFGFGKIIIFGEHLVVQGLPALVASLDLQTCAEILENNKNLIIDDQRPKAPGFVPTKLVEYRQMLENILNHIGVQKRNFSVILSGSLPVTCGGIGASAATAVAFARAVNYKFNLNLNDEQINKIAFIGECAVHGIPSGVDNTAAVFGGVIKFRKGAHGFFSKISVKSSVEVVIIDSGKHTDTKTVVSSVCDFVQANVKVSKDIFTRYEDILDQGEISLKSGDFKTLGKCMNKNHNLLRELGVSCSELDFIVKTAIQNGAVGAKLTGTGRGGLAVALTPGLDLQTHIAQYFNALGYFVIKTKFNA